jgi:hypothetical protein
MTTLKKLESFLAKLKDAQVHLATFAEDGKKTHITQATKKIESISEAVQKLVDKKKSGSKKTPKLNKYIVFSNTVRKDVMRKLGKTATMAEVAKEIGRLWQEQKESMSEASSSSETDDDVVRAPPSSRKPRIKKAAAKK